MTELKIDRIDSATHGKFLSENPPRDPYSVPAFLDSYSEVFSRDVEYLQISRNETPVAVCALFVDSRFGQRTVRLMPVKAYDGVHFRTLDDSKSQKQEYDRLTALGVLEEFLRKNYSFYQMVFQPGFPDMRAFQWAGADVIPQYTYIIDLPSFSRDGYTKSLREVLRAAENGGLTPGTCSIVDLISLNSLSYERHGRRPPVAAEKLKALLERLDVAGMLSTSSVKDREGKVIAAMASIRFNRGLFFFVSGTDAQAGKGASHLLYDSILTAEKDAGSSFVDFVGGNTPTINLFKSSFGPRLEIYFKVWRANSFTARLASMVKKI